MHTQTKITVEFLINEKLTLQKMEDLLKLILKIIVSISEISPKKSTLMRFFEKSYKIRVVIILITLTTLIFKHLSLDLT